MEGQQEGWSLQAIADLALVFDLNGLVRLANPVWHHLMGLVPQDMVGRLWTEFLHPADREEARQALVPLAEGRPVTRLVCRWQDGAAKWRDLDLSTMLDALGGLVSAIVREVPPDRSAAARLDEIEAVSGVGSWESPTDAVSPTSRRISARMRAAIRRAFRPVALSPSSARSALRRCARLPALFPH